MELLPILEKIAVPRPNHSQAVRETAVFLKEFLSSFGIPFTIQEFYVRHHHALLQGVTFILLSLLALLFIKKQRSLPALICVLGILGVITLENFTSFHIVSWVLQRPAENIIIEFKTPDSQQEVIFAAHFDSKTDMLDHIQRSVFVKLLPFMLLLGIIISLLTFPGNRLKLFNNKLFRFISLLGALGLVIYSLTVFLWLGGYIFIDKKDQSLGAVDDGASVVALLNLAKNISQAKIYIGLSDVTILLMDGEEVGYQGAYFYVNQRFKKSKIKETKPVYLINLELVGQSGTIYYSEKACSIFVCIPSDTDLKKKVQAVWQELSNIPAVPKSKTTDDSFTFARVGVPFVTIGNTGEKGVGYAGFHSKADNMERVDSENLTLMTLFLNKMIESFHTGNLNQSIR